MSALIPDYLKLKRSEKTRVNVGIALKMFLNWRYKTDFTSIENMDHLAACYLKNYQFQDLIEFILWLRETSGYQPTTISTYSRYIIKFLEYYGCHVSKAERAQLHNIMPRAVVMTQDKPFTKDILYQICSHCDPLLRAVILLATSSGMRINEVLRIEFEEIEYGHPHKIRLPRAKMKQGRPHVYRFSEEAAEVLHEWLLVREKFEKMSIIRTKNPAKTREKFQKLVFPVNVGSIYYRWNIMLELIGISERDKDTNRHVYTTHGCRRWFSSMASRHIPHEMTEALIGHDTGLSSAYRRYPEDDLDKEYLKLEPHLSIYAYDIESPAMVGDMTNVLHSLLTATTHLTTSVHTLTKKIDRIERAAEMLNIVEMEDSEETCEIEMMENIKEEDSDRQINVEEERRY